MNVELSGTQMRLDWITPLAETSTEVLLDKIKRLSSIVIIISTAFYTYNILYLSTKLCLHGQNG